jgi:hypothetical protein
MRHISGKSEDIHLENLDLLPLLLKNRRLLLWATGRQPMADRFDGFEEEEMVRVLLALFAFGKQKWKARLRKQRWERLRKDEVAANERIHEGFPDAAGYKYCR